MDAPERILVVSGDAATRDVLCSVLDTSGYEVALAESGEAGIARAAAGVLPDLGVVDLLLEAPDGPETCRRLGALATGRPLPLIGIAPRDAGPLFDRALSAGVDDFLSPPLVPQIIAARVGAQLRNVRLNTELFDQARDLELLLDLTRRFAGTLDVGGILFELVSRVAGALGIDRCSLVLADERWKRGLVLAASDDAALEDLEIDLAGYPEIQQVLRSGEPLVLQDAVGNPLVAAVKETLSAQGVGALAIFPLQHHEEPMGVLFLRARAERGPFSDRTIRVAKTIAHTTAVALRNAQLFERMRSESIRATEEKVQAEREVEDLKAIQEELRQTKDFLENLIDSSADAIVAADMDGQVLVWNKAAERVTGYGRKEALGGLHVTRLYPDRGAFEVMEMMRSEESGGPGRLEEHRLEILDRHGERIPVSLSAAILYEDGREIATMGIFTDLRERLRIEQKLTRAQDQLLRTEKQAMIAELAGTAAHELNQPLTSVMGYAELLKRRVPPEDPDHRAIDIIFRESERMAEIVRKIGRITRYETKEYLGKTRIVDLDRSATED
jgi:PAS domain S-box-containing protein